MSQLARRSPVRALAKHHLELSRVGKLHPSAAIGSWWKPVPPRSSESLLKISHAEHAPGVHYAGHHCLRLLTSASLLVVPDPVSLALSALALVVSIVSVIAAVRTANTQNRLQERLVTLETAREQDRLRQARSAELRASIERSERHFRERMVGRSSDVALVIRNEGVAPARAIRVMLDGKPALEHALIPRGGSDLTKLGAGASFRYLLAMSFQSPDVLDIMIEWDDESECARRWESQLKLS